MQTMPSMAPAEEIFTIKELSQHLRVHPTTIYRLLRQGRLPGFRVGSNWRFNRDAIEKWEREQAAGPSAVIVQHTRRRQKHA
jgi:excisionase family DNA binding protein